MAIMIILLVAMIGMMWWQSRSMKKQQAEKKNFRASLQPGTQIITIGGIIGTVVSVDNEYEEIVIDSEGSLIRFGFNAISREYTRPAYVHDDEVDENGNPLPQESDGIEQVPVDDTVESVPQKAETEVNSVESTDENK